MEDEQLWTGYVRSSRYEVQVDSEGWAAAAAQSLEHNGFCVLRSPGRVAPVELRPARQRRALTPGQFVVDPG